MQDQELISLWKSYDQKLEKVLTVNKEILFSLTQEKLNRSIGSLRGPKLTVLFFGIPFTILLYFLTFIAYSAGGIFPMIGFGSISLILTGLIIGYSYHLVLINQIRRSGEIAVVQRKLASLTISSFNLTRLGILQLPFWSICWMSMDALTQSPFIYGGVNLAVFLGLTFLAFYIYKRLDFRQRNSKVSRIFLAGKEWEPLVKSAEILEEMDLLVNG